jgi:hypothetical protein
MWWLIQSPIIFAVIALNIHYHWTPNGYLAGLIPAGAAYGVTILLSYLIASLHLSEPVTRTESYRPLLRTIVQLSVVYRVTGVATWKITGVGVKS